MDQFEFKCPEGWTMYRSVLYKKYKDPKPSTRFAIYDMDNTLMFTPSLFVQELAKGVMVQVAKPVIPNDFALYSKNLRDKLLNELGKGTRHDIYRKPGNLVPLHFGSAPGILLFFEKYLNSGLKIDFSDSFYVGDAAGRRLPYKVSSIMLRNILNRLKSIDFSKHRYYNVDGEGNVVHVDANAIISRLTISKMRNVFSYDFSDCDLKFAINSGMRFFTPDEYFYDLPPYELNVKFDPKNLGLDPFFPTVQSGLMVIIGNLSSGKTYLAKNCTKFSQISESNFLSREKFMRALKAMLSEGKNVVVDDTNHVASKRVELVQLARSLNAYVTFVHLDLSQNLINHLNKIRRLYSDEGTREFFDVPDSAESCHKKGDLRLKVERPTLDEGADAIYTIVDDCFPMEHNRLTLLHLP
ncbi:uncharacterized protein TOT_010000083 [Theileria orientalis strain Shintoku]|uniref:Uncharacterized protein n=1 Tax=Theileria orientalis strain Shintoku TaxID=869250 RepID=J7M4I9_THEOR|nr:uncharacterized protein TOT_010000083 [Theileria orientalis strain Shintoku]BAM38615.1 uncharacterized protein TOT_010000083 [Theileria orientalis strain Shintoku]|eukprot:XP_009688916.1 uncharacterized protein TOT_010000083 [Theileria orientalis strain Shintoku]